MYWTSSGRGEAERIEESDDAVSERGIGWKVPSNPLIRACFGWRATEISNGRQRFVSSSMSLAQKEFTLVGMVGASAARS